MSLDKRKPRPSWGRTNRPALYSSADKEVIFRFLERYHGMQNRALRRVAELCGLPGGEFYFRQLDYLTWTLGLIKFMTATLRRARVTDGPGLQEVIDQEGKPDAIPA